MEDLACAGLRASAGRAPSSPWEAPPGLSRPLVTVEAESGHRGTHHPRGWGSSPRSLWSGGAGAQGLPWGARDIRLPDPCPGSLKNWGGAWLCRQPRVAEACWSRDPQMLCPLCSQRARPRRGQETPSLLQGWALPRSPPEWEETPRELGLPGPGIDSSPSSCGRKVLPWEGAGSGCPGVGGMTRARELCLLTPSAMHRVSLGPRLTGAGGRRPCPHLAVKAISQGA